MLFVHLQGSKSPFQELNSKSSIREQLANLVILEYPVIHVFLPSDKYDFEVIKVATPCNAKNKNSESVMVDEFCQTGIEFKEEAVKDDSLDPLVSDLMNTQDSLELVPENHKDHAGFNEELEEGEIL